MRSMSAFGEGCKELTAKREQRRRNIEGVILEDLVGNIAEKKMKKCLG